MLKIDYKYYTNHIIPQHYFVTDKDKNIIVDKIIKFEEMQKDINNVRTAYNIKKELPKFNATKHRHYSTYYDDELKQLVVDTYKLDFEIFMYSTSF